MAVAYKKNRLFPGLVLCSALLWMSVLTSPARAVVVGDLYQASVPVTGQDEARLNEAYRAGLEKVLVRVSGDRDVIRRDGMAAQLDNAPSLVASSALCFR